MTADAQEIRKPWLYDGNEYSESEGGIVGSREALEKLSGAIQTVLTTDTPFVRLEGVTGSWDRVILDKNSAPMPSKPTSLAERLKGLAIIVFVIGVFVYPLILGWITLAGWLAR